MKKILILLFVSVFLFVGCSNQDNPGAIKSQEDTQTGKRAKEVNSGESENNNEIGDTKKKENEIYSDDVKEFINKFNQLDSPEDDVNLIENVEPAKEEENGYTQTLYSSTDYVISTLYEKSGEVKSYIVVIPENQPYEKLEGNAFNAMLHVGEALDLNAGELAKEFEKALPNHAGMYLTDDYTITFSTNDEVPEVGMIIMFMNISFTDADN